MLQTLWHWLVGIWIFETVLAALILMWEQITTEVPMHTKDILATALREAGLNEMADKAATGYYHDFLSPLDLPEMQLDADLVAVGTPEAMALRKRHHNGDFDASTEESEEWADSPDGQDAIRRLIRR